MLSRQSTRSQTGRLRYFHCMLRSRVHSTMMSLPFEHGFAPSRWRQCMEVMLEKQLGNPHCSFANPIFSAAGNSRRIQMMRRAILKSASRRTMMRWRQCLEVMLEKQPGNPLIHRIRIIVLLEADFNIALRIIWMRRLFPAAEKMGFPKEQWGS